MDAAKRAQVAVRLLAKCMGFDDEDGTTFLGSVIKNEGLWRHCSPDTSTTPFASFDEFVDAMNAEYA